MNGIVTEQPVLLAVVVDMVTCMLRGIDVDGFEAGLGATSLTQSANASFVSSVILNNIKE